MMMGRQTFESSIKTQPQQANGEELDLRQLLAHPSDNSRLVFLHGDVSEHSIASVIAQLLMLANTNSNPIHLVVSTYGGSVDEMFSLYDTIKFLPCPVHTVGLGKVMSAGVLLLAAGEKGKRLMGASGRVMMHSVSGGVSGNVFEVQNETNEHVRLHNMMIDALAKETKMSRKKIESIMSPKLDSYFTAEQALKMGIVDKIIGAK